MAYVKPIRPMIVISSDKAKEFTAQKPNLEARQERKKMVAIFRAKNTK